MFNDMDTKAIFPVPHDITEMPACAHDGFTGLVYVSLMFDTLHGECEVTRACEMRDGKVVSGSDVIGWRCARSAVTKMREYLSWFEPETKSVFVSGRAHGVWLTADDGFPTVVSA